MATIGERLREERKRLGLDQAAFGTAVGSSKASQIRYESGERSPDGNFFADAFKLGVDVMYVITGIRLPAHLVAETNAAYQVPSVMVAEELSVMSLTKNDADLILAMAHRLNGDGVSVETGADNTRTTFGIPTSAEGARQPAEFERKKDKSEKSVGK